MRVQGIIQILGNRFEFQINERTRSVLQRPYNNIVGVSMTKESPNAHKVGNRGITEVGLLSGLTPYLAHTDELANLNKMSLIHLEGENLLA